MADVNLNQLLKDYEDVRRAFEAMNLKLLPQVSAVKIHQQFAYLSAAEALQKLPATAVGWIQNTDETVRSDFVKLKNPLYGEWHDGNCSYVLRHLQGENYGFTTVTENTGDDVFASEVRYLASDKATPDLNYRRYWTVDANAAVRAAGFGFLGTVLKQGAAL